MELMHPELRKGLAEDRACTLSRTVYCRFADVPACTVTGPCALIRSRRDAGPMP